MFYNRSNHFLIVNHCQRGWRLNNEELFIFLMKSELPSLQKPTYAKLDWRYCSKRTLSLKSFQLNCEVSESALDIQQLESPLSLPLTGQMAPSTRSRVELHHWRNFCLCFNFLSSSKEISLLSDIVQKESLIVLIFLVANSNSSKSCTLSVSQSVGWLVINCDTRHSESVLSC